MIALVILLVLASFFPVLTALVLATTVSKQTWAGVAALVATMTVMIVAGQHYIPDLIVMGHPDNGNTARRDENGDLNTTYYEVDHQAQAEEQVRLASLRPNTTVTPLYGSGTVFRSNFIKAKYDDLDLACCVFGVLTPVLAVLAVFGVRSKRGPMYGFLGVAAAYWLAAIVNAFDVFGTYRVYAWQAANVISVFILCSYKVSRHYWCAVVTMVVLLPMLAMCHNLTLTQTALLYGFLVVAAMLFWWCLPKESAQDWEDDVIKYAAMASRDSHWLLSEPLIREQHGAGHVFASLPPPFEPEDISDLVETGFGEWDLKSKQQMSEAVLGLLNHRWDKATLICTWNQMIDDRDERLLPDSASFKTLRKAHPDEARIEHEQAKARSLIKAQADSKARNVPVFYDAVSDRYLCPPV
jgi:hypothetical protein